MNTVTDIRSIPLANILPASDNVRTAKAGELSDIGLRESIRAKGVMQSLAVYEENGSFYAAAGGRRLLACKALLEEGHLSEDHELPCIVVEQSKAVDVSLTENFHRDRMHPADEFVAFSKLVAQGSTVDSISLEYGIDVKEVKQRLGLAAVAPKIITAYRNDEFGLDVVKAFTLEPSKKKQLAFYNGHDGNLTAWRVREAFTENTFKSDCSLALFVGLDAYIEAGGAVINDLFSNVSHLGSYDLMEQLATAKMESLKEDYLKQGWKWVEYSLNYQIDGAFVEHLDADRSAVPVELDAKLKAKESELSKLEDSISWNSDEDLTDDEVEACEASIVSLEADILVVEEEIEGLLFYSAEQMKRAGVYLRVLNGGSLDTNIGVVRKGDVVVEGEIDGGEVNIKPVAKGISQALAGELGGYANQLTQLELIQNPELSALIFQFETCYSKLSNIDAWSWDKMFNVGHEHRPAIYDGAQDSAAYASLLGAIDSIDSKWIKGSVEQSFVAFSALSPKKRAIVFGQVVATLAGDVTSASKTKTVQRELNKRTGFNRAQYWRPTIGNYLGRVSIPTLSALAQSLFGKAWVDSRSTLKKKQLGLAIEDCFDTDKADLTDKIKAKAAAWLPDELK